MGLSLVSVECHGFYNKPIEIFKISGITLLGGLLCLFGLAPHKLAAKKWSDGKCFFEIEFSVDFLWF